MLPFGESFISTLWDLATSYGDRQMTDLSLCCRGCQEGEKTGAVWPGARAAPRSAAGHHHQLHHLLRGGLHHGVEGEDLHVVVGGEGPGDGDEDEVHHGEQHRGWGLQGS